MEIKEIRLLDLTEAAELVEHHIEWVKSDKDINDLFEAHKLINRVIERNKD